MYIQGHISNTLEWLLKEEGRNMTGNYNEGKKDKMRKALLMIM